MRGKDSNGRGLVHQYAEIADIHPVPCDLEVTTLTHVSDITTLPKAQMASSSRYCFTLILHFCSVVDRVSDPDQHWIRIFGDLGSGSTLIVQLEI